MKIKYKPDAPRLSDDGLVFESKMYYGFTDGASTLYDYSGGGFLGTATNSPVPSYPGMKFTAASSQDITIGTGPSSVKTASFWLNQDDVAGLERIFELNGTDSLLTSSGTIVAAGFTTLTLYRDAVVVTSGVDVITANWHHLVLVATGAKNATAFKIGTSGGGYMDGLIADFRLYSVALSASRVSDIYQLQRHRYQT